LHIIIIKITIKNRFNITVDTLQRRYSDYARNIVFKLPDKLILYPPTTQN